MEIHRGLQGGVFHPPDPEAALGSYFRDPAMLVVSSGRIVHSGSRSAKTPEQVALVGNRAVRLPVTEG